MSTQPRQTYQFDGNTVRPMTEQDRPYLEMQIQADEYHRDKMNAGFLPEPVAGRVFVGLGG